MPAPYGEYARVYDSIGQPRYSLSMVDWIATEIERLGITGRRLVDIACGTGSAAIELARRGFDVTGVDVSPAMLDEARRKAKGAGHSIEFIEQDMRRLRLRRKFDVATCLYDSFNYLLSLDDLRLALEGARQLLRPGGTFIFDFNTPHHFQGWDGRDNVAVDTDQLFGVYHHRYDPDTRRNEVVMTFFAQAGDGYRRWSESHVQRAYEHDEVAGVVKGAGFTLARAVPRPGEGDGGPARRWIFICLNPA